MSIQGYRDEEPEPRPEYFVRISLGGSGVELPVVGDDCTEVLLGRDFLRHMVVRLDGPAQEFTLEPGKTPASWPRCLSRAGPSIVLPCQLLPCPGPFPIDWSLTLGL